MAIGVSEEGAFPGQLIDGWSFGHFVSIAGKGISLEIVGNDQEHVLDLIEQREGRARAMTWRVMTSSAVQHPTSDSSRIARRGICASCAR